MDQWIKGLGLVLTLSVLSLSAQAQSEGYDCYAEGEDNVVCMALPTGTTQVEDQAKLIEQQAKTSAQGGGAASKISMLTESDLTGRTWLESEAGKETLLNPATIAEQKLRQDTLARFQATRANQTVRDLHIFLDLTGRTGGTGDTAVISAGQR